MSYKRELGRNTYYAHVICAYLNGFKIRVTAKKEHALKVSAQLQVRTLGRNEQMKQIFYRRYAINYKDYSRFQSFSQFYQEEVQKGGQSLVFLLKRQKENIRMEKLPDLTSI